MHIPCLYSISNFHVGGPSSAIHLACSCYLNKTFFHIHNLSLFIHLTCSKYLKKILFMYTIYYQLCSYIFHTILSSYDYVLTISPCRLSHTLIVCPVCPKISILLCRLLISLASIFIPSLWKKWEAYVCKNSSWFTVLYIFWVTYFHDYQWTKLEIGKFCAIYDGDMHIM